MSEGGLRLLPCKAGVCQECAADHKNWEPHNRDSLYYQFKFYGQHGRWPTWEDAMAHCTEDVKILIREVVQGFSDRFAEEGGQR